MPSEAAATTNKAAAPASRSTWLTGRLEELGLATRIDVRWRLRPRRVDVLLDGRPAALLMQPTTPLFDRR
jgi:hypothetical protein